MASIGPSLFQVGSQTFLLHEMAKERAAEHDRVCKDLCNYRPFQDLVVSEGIDPHAVQGVIATMRSGRPILSVYGEDRKPIDLALESEGDPLILQAAAFLLGGEDPPVFPAFPAADRRGEGRREIDREIGVPGPMREESPEFLRTFQSLFNTFKETQIAIAKEHTKQIQALSRGNRASGREERLAEIRRQLHERLAPRGEGSSRSLASESDGEESSAYATPHAAPDSARPLHSPAAAPAHPAPAAAGDLQRQLRTAQLELERLRPFEAQYGPLTRQLTENRLAYNQLFLERGQLAHAFQMQGQQLQHSNATLTQVAAERDQLQQTLSNAHSNARTHQLHAQRLQRECTRLQSEIGRQEQRIQLLERRCGELAQQLSDTRLERDRFQFEMERLGQLAANYRTQAERTVELEAQLNLLRQNYNRLNERLATTMEERETLQQTLQEARATIQQLQTELEKQRRTIAELQKSLEAATFFFQRKSPSPSVQIEVEEEPREASNREESPDDAPTHLVPLWTPQRKESRPNSRGENRSPSSHPNPFRGIPTFTDPTIANLFRGHVGHSWKLQNPIPYSSRFSLASETPLLQSTRIVKKRPIPKRLFLKKKPAQSVPTATKKWQRPTPVPKRFLKKKSAEKDLLSKKGFPIPWKRNTGTRPLPIRNPFFLLRQVQQAARSIK